MTRLLTPRFPPVVAARDRRRRYTSPGRRTDKRGGTETSRPEPCNDRGRATRSRPPASLLRGTISPYRNSMAAFLKTRKLLLPAAIVAAAALLVAWVVTGRIAARDRTQLVANG